MDRICAYMVMNISPSGVRKYWTDGDWDHGPRNAIQSVARSQMVEYYWSLVSEGCHHITLILIEYAHRDGATTVYRILELQKA